MPGRLQFGFTFGKTQPERPPQPSQGAMRILLMGDFSGRNSRNEQDSGSQLDKRRIYPVDIDNFNAVISHIAPQLHLNLEESTGTGVVLHVTQLEDFHPDHLYSSLDIFRALKTLRTRLSDSTTYSEAVVDLQKIAQITPVAHLDASTSDAPKAGDHESSQDLLERILGKSGAMQSAGNHPSEIKSGIQRLIKDIVAPYSVPATEPHQAQYITALDETVSKTMRSVLHHPEFQALEALWHATHDLVFNLGTEQELKIYLLDVSKNELKEDIEATEGELEKSQLFQLLHDNGAGMLGGEPWSTFIGAYTFSMKDKDLTLLASLGAIGSQLGTPFIAAADSSFLGCRSLVDTPDPSDWKRETNEAQQIWQALRESIYADWIGLVEPRILIRLPYGKNYDPVEKFAFEELNADYDHASFVWGNPAFFCAQLIVASFQSRGWAMRLGDALEVDDLPAYTYKEDGESKLLACAEVYLTDRAAEKILDGGIMPLVSYRNRNAVRLMRFQSIADPVSALAGPWQ